MSRNSLRNLMSLVVWLGGVAYAGPLSLERSAAYLPFSLFRQASANADLLGWIRAQSGKSLEAIEAPSLKDFPAIRAEAAKRGAATVWIFQRARGMDSATISAILMSTGDGRVLSEGAFPSNDFSAFRAEVSEWLPRAVAQMQNASSDSEPLIQALAASGRCEDLSRFLPAGVARVRCQGTSFKSLSDPIKLSFRQVSADVKPLWIDEIDGSTLVREAQKILTKPAGLRLECSEECKRASLTLTIYTTPDLLAGDADPLARLTGLCGNLLEYMSVAAKRSKLAMDRPHLILISSSGYEMDMAIEGTQRSPRLRPTQSIQSFIERD